MANNQYNFLDYAGLSLFWNNVKSIIEENELATASALTNLDTRVDNVESSKSDKGHTHNFGEIAPGVATIGDGANRLMFRTNSSYKNGIYYSTPGNEALVFGTITPITSWIFATVDPTLNTAWTSLTPSLQIKNGRVTINKLIANNTDASYNLDVNGSANATTLYENGVRVSVDGHTHDYLPLSGGTMDSGAGIKWPDRTSSTWDTFGLDANTGLQILNTVGVSSTNAPSDYSVGLSVSGYYGFCLAYYGGGNDWWLKGNSDKEWKIVIHGGNIGSQSVKYATSAGSAPASDVYSWAKQSTKPSYSFSEITSKPTTVSGYGITDALTTSNYTTYTVKKDGTGASGTWGISITGNANYATTAGSAPASDVKTWAKADTKPSYTGTEVTLSGYSKNNSYTPIASGDSVQAAIAKLEGAINGLEDLLASI